MIALAPGLGYGRRTSTGVSAADGATRHDRQFILSASHKPGDWMAPLPAATNSRRAFMLIRAMCQHALPTAREAYVGAGAHYYRSRQGHLRRRRR